MSDELFQRPPEEPRVISRGVFWFSVPAIILSALSVTLLLKWNRQFAPVIVVVDVFLALLLLVLINPRRFAWAGRIIGGLIFAACAWYLIDVWIIKGGKMEPTLGAHNKPTPWNAVLAMVLFGLPGLWLMVTGRLGFGAKATQARR
jgi:Mn2+/Fe2+ NRAMP family transporter